MRRRLGVVVILPLVAAAAGCHAEGKTSRRDDGRAAPFAVRSSSPIQPGSTMNQASPVPEPERIQRAAELMMDFVQRTGLTGEHAQRRYLWTDAFAVCNLLGLAAQTRDARYTELAMRLVTSVHQTLGRHRADDARSGWISGLETGQGQAHPTRGGLRIGKPLPERGVNEPLNERLEWNRDGQYFHYLIQWMHALDRVARSTGQPTFNVWARELADTAFRRFTYIPPGGHPRRMHWKMSIDLSRPLVPSMGQHDPLDGAVIYAELKATAARLRPQVDEPRIGDEAAQLAAMVQRDNLATTDPLGLGGLLVDAFRMQQLMHEGAFSDEDLLQATLAAALSGLRAYARQGELQLPASERLAFRELGLAIGLRAVALMSATAQAAATAVRVSPNVRASLAALERYVSLATTIESFWLEPEHRRVSTWTEHRDINDVMLATSLLPAGLLTSADSD